MATTFGFSAFLKLLLQNPKPRLKSIRSRLNAGGDAYDFHRSLRLKSRNYLIKGMPLSDVLASVGDITASSERKSVLSALNNLRDWRDQNPSKIVGFQKVVYESPQKLFKVSFDPDFGIEVGAKMTAIHIWNTKTPELESSLVYAALSLFRGAFCDAENVPDDLALLSLLSCKLYCLSEVSDYSDRSLRDVREIEDIFKKVRDEDGLPPAKKDHPGSPRPSV